MPDDLLDSLLAAVAGRPTDVPLRLHLADLLIRHGRLAEAVQQCAAVLALRPSNGRAVELLGLASAGLAAGEGQGTAGAERTGWPDGSDGPPDFDWTAAEEQVRDIALPPGQLRPAGPDGARPATPRQVVTLADVGGLAQVKSRLETAFLGPARNPELARSYGVSGTGGLLLYGPPGCGKTFVARAVAGELGARFSAVSLAEVLDAYLGNTEKNVREMFAAARRASPCVLFLDEVDAIGHRRSSIGPGWTGLRGAVNQLLTEMDSVSGSRDGVFVLAATNAPWDVDPALRRPGRLDRTLLVLPPDRLAREAILRFHLRDRLVAGVDVVDLARRTADFSGADLAHVCDTAAESVLTDAARTGRVRPIGPADLTAAIDEVRPSIGPWLQTARNVALFANSSGEYDELAAYLKSRKLL